MISALTLVAFLFSPEILGSAVIAAAITAGFAAWIHRRRPKLDEISIQESNERLKALIRDNALANGEARVQLLRELKEIAFGLLRETRDELTARTRAMAEIAVELEGVQKQCVDLEIQILEQRNRLTGEFALERSRMGDALDAERRARMSEVEALQVQLDRAHVEIEMLKGQVVREQREKDGLHRQIEAAKRSVP